MNDIDIVLPWVDGNDPQWLGEKSKYSPVKEDYSCAANRFRDWGNLQFLFRGIEKYAPWVHRIYFITWGHCPKWLNTAHPGLRIINHKDYIPEKYLPTFNSNVIELNLNRLGELSEQFVLFNDDTFLLKPTRPEDFFINGVPRDEFALNPILAKGEKFRIAHTNVNNTGVINEHFDKKECFRKYKRKYINRLYGKENIRTLLLQPWDGFAGFKNHHLPLSHLKSTFDELWKEEPVLMDETCRNKFRGYNDLNHWLMRYWNLCNGKFEPRSSRFGKYFNISDDNRKITDYISNQTGAMICINDMSTEIDFDKAKTELIDAFNKILPEKSEFEL